MSRRIDHDGRGNLRIRFRFDRSMVDLVKTLPDRRWNGAEKYWWVPDLHVVQAVDLLTPAGFECDEATLKLYSSLGGLLNPKESVTQAEPGNEQDYTVSRLNRTAASALQAVFPGAVWVVGEISGYNKNSHRRHIGFQLVERDRSGKETAQVNAILFEGVKSTVRKRLESAGDPFELEDEISVRLLVRPELYEPWGQYRIRIEDLDVNYTLGEAARRREEIVRRLTEDGLVGMNTGLSFPQVPLRVGLITSLGSDAYNDVLRTFQESGFAFDVKAHGARVQGHHTEPSVLNALDALAAEATTLDIVIICRGGGSRTDLAWFDSESLGRAVARFPVPVVIGIGHEQDVSVLDAVGWRAKTPTAAAGMLVEAVESYLDRIAGQTIAILNYAGASIGREKITAAERARRLVRSAQQLSESRKEELRHRRTRIARGAGNILQAASRELRRSAAGIPRSASILVVRRSADLDRATRQLVQGASRDVVSAGRRILQLASQLKPYGLRRLVLESERSDTRQRRLHLVDPKRVVERGYAILRGERHGTITAPAQAPEGAMVTAELRDGRLLLRSEGQDKEEE